MTQHHRGSDITAVEGALHSHHIGRVAGDQGFDAIVNDLETDRQRIPSLGGQRATFEQTVAPSRSALDYSVPQDSGSWINAEHFQRLCLRLPPPLAGLPRYQSSNRPWI